MLRNNRRIYKFECEWNQNGTEYFSNSTIVYCVKKNYSRRVPANDIYQNSFRDCSFHQLPNMLKLSTQLKYLNISYTDWQWISNFDSKNPDLQSFLNVSNDMLTQVLSLRFSNLDRENEINLSFNKINRIDPFAFEGVMNLIEIILSRNNISSLGSRVFRHLDQLKSLYLDYNAIETLEDGVFDHLPQLEILVLNDNRLKGLQCQLFSNVVSLAYLNLDSNYLDAFNPSCIRNRKPFGLSVSFNRLKNLVLTGNVGDVFASANDIEHLTVTENLKNLSQLVLHSNRIKNIPELLEHLNSSLIRLDLSNNHVGALNINTFAKFENLRYLYLRNSNLSNIQYGTFHHQKNLRVLDISYNNLKTINFAILGHNSANLEEILLNRNQLTEVDGLNESNFPKLRKFQIMSNNFECDYLVRFLRQWDRIQSDQLFTDGTHVRGIDCHQSTNSKHEKTVAETIMEFIRKPLIFICALLSVICSIYFAHTFVSMQMKKKRALTMERSVAYTSR